MPKLDGTGPQGAGPLTGRGCGKCNGAQRTGMGRGLGCRGGRRGFGRMAVGLSPVETRKALKIEKELLKQELEAVEKGLKAQK
ncbi:MAG TPA: DUF5320 domain-containing protein [Patescibacteria group bacterium]|nr:DUF5320 domain-containing protein [Patescibacteria group bacterium]